MLVKGATGDYEPNTGGNVDNMYGILEELGL